MWSVKTSVKVDNLLVTIGMRIICTFFATKVKLGDIKNNFFSSQLSKLVCNQLSVK